MTYNMQMVLKILYIYHKNNHSDILEIYASEQHQEEYSNILQEKIYQEDKNLYNPMTIFQLLLVLPHSNMHTILQLDYHFQLQHYYRLSIYIQFQIQDYDIHHTFYTYYYQSTVSKKVLNILHSFLLVMLYLLIYLM